MQNVGQLPFDATPIMLEEVGWQTRRPFPCSILSDFGVLDRDQAPVLIVAVGCCAR